MEGTRPGVSGLGAIAAAAALWALGGNVATLLFREGVTPFELAEARAVLAAVGFAALGGWRRAREGDLPAVLVPALGLSIAGVNLTYYLAIERLPVAVGIVLQYTGPALVVAWIGLVTRRRPSGRVAVALGAALLGVVLVSELAAGELSRVDGVGVLMGLAAAVFFASYTLLSERAEPVLGPLGLMARGCALAAGFWILLQAPRGWPAALFEVDHLAAIAFVGFGATMAPFLLFVWGVGKVRAERAAIAATLEPVLAAVVAWAWLGQTLSAMQIAGGTLVVGAVVALARRPAPVLAPEP